MNQPKQPNPALAHPQYPGGAPQQPQQGYPPQQQQGYPPAQQQGYPPPQQQPQGGFPPQQQQPPQQQGSGLVDPSGQPVQAQYFPLRINHDGPAIPTPSMDPSALMGNIPQIPFSMVVTWLEIFRALDMRDFNAAWLERRIADIEKKLGIEPISADAFLQETQAEIAAMQQRQAAAGQSQAQPPQQPQAQGQPAAQGQPQQQPPQGTGS